MNMMILRPLVLATLFIAICIPQIRSEQQLRGHVEPRGLHESCVLCRMTMFDTIDPSGFSPEQTPKCIPIINEVEMDTEYYIALPQDILNKYEAEIDQGQLLVRLCDAKFEDDTLKIGDSPSHAVVTDAGHRHLLTQHLAIKSRMSIALISIRTSDSTPRYSAQDMANNMFGSGINLQTQYDLCSFGKQSFYPSEHLINEYVAAPIRSFGQVSDLVNTAQAQIKARMRINSVAELADKIMVCIPPGTGSWAASAGVGHWRVQMNSDWCISLSGTIHELGHTVGLLHSNEPGKPYEDQSGYMGSGYTNPVWPQKCFNGYHSWRFGWYSDRHHVISANDSNGQLVKLATFVDFDKAATDEKVIVNISDKLFLLYNVAKHFNVDTEKKQNQVSVTEPTTQGTDSIAGLSAGQRFKVSNFDNSGKTLYIEACKTMHGSNGADVMLLSIALNKSLCGAPLPPAPQSYPQSNPAVPKPTPPASKPTPPAPKPAPPAPNNPPALKPTPPVSTCSANGFLRECTTTRGCQGMYQSATDCHNGGGGVCMCGSDVCGCTGGATKLSVPKPVAAQAAPKPSTPSLPQKSDYLTWLLDFIKRLTLQRRQS